METPDLFKKNLKEGKVNYEMLGACIYSFNKRAKNCRDRYREYVWKYRHSGWWEKDYISRSMDEVEAKKDEYYGYKDYFLTLLSPYKIHKCRRWNERLDIEIVEYFLYFEVAGYSFHHPISKDEITNYNLEIVELPSDFNTEGEGIEELLSVQFAKKVYAGLKNGTLCLIA